MLVLLVLVMLTGMGCYNRVGCYFDIGCRVLYICNRASTFKVGISLLNFYFVNQIECYFHMRSTVLKPFSFKETLAFYHKTSIAFRPSTTYFTFQHLFMYPFSDFHLRNESPFKPLFSLCLWFKSTYSSIEPSFLTGRRPCRR